MAFPTPQKPISPLGYHRTLAPTCGLKVSPLCLGAMSLGDAWAQGYGAVKKKTAFEIMDHFYEQGGNFIDTANNYQHEQSETWLGEWMAERGVREEMVIATKYTTPWRLHRGGKTCNSNFGGNNAKSLRHSLDDSLAKLQTDFIDILFVHWWDFSTSVPEVMHALHNVVQQGKVLYIGISDTPAWIVSKANEYARANSLTPFIIYQGKWSASCRDFERDILPMCRDQGMAIHPWGALGNGQFKTKAQRAIKGGRDYGPPQEVDLKVSEMLEQMAKKKNTTMTSIALSYVMHKQPYVFPLIGCRTVDHLKGNIAALNLVLSRDDINEIEKAYPFDLGFPLNLFAAKPEDVSRNVSGQDIWATRLAFPYDGVFFPQPILLGLHEKEIAESQKAASTKEALTFNPFPLEETK